VGQLYKLPVDFQSAEARRDAKGGAVQSAAFRPQNE
jgi:hypothetical protein